MKIYCVGLFRTGTNTIYEVFKRSFRASHEFMIMPSLVKIRDYIKGDISRAEFVGFVKTRDALGNLEVDSSGFNYAFVDILLDEYPHAKFILTIRDCYSWVNSSVGYIYKNYYKEDGQFIRRLLNSVDHLPDNRFAWNRGPECKFRLEQLISMWGVVIRNILRSVPSDRLLVLKTDELSYSIARIAEFAGVPEAYLDADHANRGDEINYLECFDGARLESLFERHCSDLMGELFGGASLSMFMESKKTSCPLDSSDVLSLFSLDGLAHEA